MDIFSSLFDPSVIVAKTAEDELQTIAKRIQSAIDYGTACVYHREGSIPCLMNVCDIHKGLRNNPDNTFTGWDNLDYAVMVDFSVGVMNSKKDLLKEFNFNENTIKYWKSEKCSRFHKSGIYAIHVVFKPTSLYSWADYIIDTNEPVLPAATDLYVKGSHSSYRLVEVCGDFLKLSLVKKNNTVYRIAVAGKELDLECLKDYLQHKSKNIAKLVEKFKEGDTNTYEWDETSGIRSFIKERHIGPRHKKTNWVEELIAERKQTKSTEETSNIVTPDDLKRAIKQNRRYRCKEHFYCSFCRIHHSEGYRFYVKNNEFKVCKFCYEEIKGIKPYGKEILVNMGGKR